MKRTSLIFAVVVVLAVGAAVLVNEWGAGTGYPSESGPLIAYSDSTRGLRLSVSINASSLTSGEWLLITTTEMNIHEAENNVSSAQSWSVSGLGLSSCQTSVYPFGIAVYQGDYTLVNVSSAVPLRIFPYVPCPMFVRLVTGYSFEPNSDLAVVLPGAGAPTLMGANLTVSGTYSPGLGSSPAGGVVAPLPFEPGAYTVVAGDEWGSLVFLHFHVEG